MPTKRETHEKEYKSDDESFTVKVQIIDSITITSGKGSSYQKTTMKPIFDSDEGDPENRENGTLKVYSPNDDSVFVEIPVATSMEMTSGTGSSYQKRIYKFRNDPEDDTPSDSDDARTFETHHIFSSDDISGQPNPDDPYIAQEVIKTLTVVSGTASSYQKRYFSIDNSDLPDDNRIIDDEGDPDPWL